jgi:DNA-directed RNA polymerase subunit RPC12/RpoP
MSDEVERVSAHGDPIVKYCAVCGVEFDEHVSSNKWFRCDSCDSVIQVKNKNSSNNGNSED